MAFLSFHVFFCDLHPELEFMWVLMQKQAGYMAVYPALKRLAKPSQKAGANAASTTASQMTANYAPFTNFLQYAHIACKGSNLGSGKTTVSTIEDCKSSKA